MRKKIEKTVELTRALLAFLTNHENYMSQSWHLKTMLPMHLPLQCRLKGWLPNMHGRHPEPTIGPYIIFSNIVGLLLGNHARDGATSSKWPTEMALAVIVGHCDGVAQAFTLKKMHRGKGMPAGGA